MNEEAHWDVLVEMDEELLLGGVMIPEWCTFVVREADVAFVHGAYLASIITAVSGIETYLRSEYPETGKNRLVELINDAALDPELQNDLHRLRKYRNKWVHVDNAWEDESLLRDPESKEKEFEEMAFFAARLLRRTIYQNPWI